MKDGGPTARPKSTRAQITQAALTGVGLLLALYAYGNWRNQERGKRQADFAIEALRQAYATKGCFTSAARGIEPGRLSELQEAGRLADKVMDSLTSCERDGASLMASSELASQVLDFDVAKELIGLASMFSDLSQPIGSLSVAAIIYKSPNAWWSQHQDAVKAQLSFFAAKKCELGSKCEAHSDFESLANVRVKLIEERLRRYHRFF